jgi:hypothetical protein
VADLNGVLQPEQTPVVICDVEGYEAELLNPLKVPSLRNSRILVETHEFVVPGITTMLKERFAESHDIEQIWQQARSRSDFPWQTFVTRLLPKSYLDWAVSEWRPERMTWLWMQPKGLRGV